MRSCPAVATSPGLAPSTATDSAVVLPALSGGGSLSTAANRFRLIARTAAAARQYVAAVS